MITPSRSLNLGEFSRCDCRDQRRRKASDRHAEMRRPHPNCPKIGKRLGGGVVTRLHSHYACAGAGISPERRRSERSNCRMLTPAAMIRAINRASAAADIGYVAVAVGSTGFEVLHAEPPTSQCAVQFTRVEPRFSA